MKPPRFDYVAPRSVQDAVDALATPGAVVLAGGQSLLLELVYRERRPSVVVDVNGIADLESLTTDTDSLTIGALVRHRSLETSDGSPLRTLLSRAAPYIAHPPIRSRGTFCGSVAWGYRSAEWNAVCAALGAIVHLGSRAGSRDVAASDWYLGDRRTAVRPGEMITSVSLPLPPEDCGVGFSEHRRTHGTFADAAAAVVLGLTEGAVSFARVGVVGPSDVPLRLHAVEDALLTRSPGVAAATARAAARDASWPDHIGAVVAELVGRSVARAVTDLTPNADAA